MQSVLADPRLCARQAAREQGREKLIPRSLFCFWTWQLLCVLHTCTLTCSNPDPDGYGCSQPGLSIQDRRSPEPPPVLPGRNCLQRGMDQRHSPNACLGGTCTLHLQVCLCKTAECLCLGSVCQVLLPGRRVSRAGAGCCCLVPAVRWGGRTGCRGRH